MAQYRTRSIEHFLQSIIGVTPVIMISGARQVGKTTLLEYISHKSQTHINYVTLDNLFIRQQAIEDPDLFLRTYEPPLIIDEFRYAPNLLSYIKMKVDNARSTEMFEDGKTVGTMYYLTGSQIFNTLNNVSESLAGRISIYDLFGYSTRELNNLEESLFIPKIGNLKNKTRVPTVSTMQLFERILNGSYPEIYSSNRRTKDDFYENYIRTYIERDIRQIINVSNETKFIKFISSIAARTAQEFNASDIAKDIGVDSKTIEQWVSLLRNSGLIYFLQAYSNNNVQKAIKRPKIYFMDTGLACYLSGYHNVEILEKSAYNGAIFETYIISEILKSYYNNGINPKSKLFYYRDTNKKEIDLLVFDEDTVFPIEIKKSGNPGKQAIKNFDILNKLDYKIGNGIVLCMTEKILPIDDNNFLVPIEFV